MSALQQAKQLIVDHLHLAKDALHIHVVLLVFFLAMLVCRWRARQWRPWLVALAVALAGEVWDIVDTLNGGGRPRLWANWHDVWNGMLWPTAILLLARYSAVFGKGR